MLKGRDPGVGERVGFRARLALESSTDFMEAPHNISCIKSVFAASQVFHTMGLDNVRTRGQQCGCTSESLQGAKKISMHKT